MTEDEKQDKENRGRREEAQDPQRVGGVGPRVDVDVDTGEEDEDEDETVQTPPPAPNQDLPK